MTKTYYNHNYLHNYCENKSIQLIRNYDELNSYEIWIYNKKKEVVEVII
jgi:hypothetical protein